MPKELTELERSILRYMVDYLRTHTYQPSIREIGREFGIKSTRTVAEYLQSLADKGWVERDSSRSRGVRLASQNVFPDFMDVPAYDALISGDQVLGAESHQGVFAFDRRLVDCEDAFLVPMDGDGMNGDGILSGDMLLVERVEDDGVEADDIVVARAGRKPVVRRLAADATDGGGDREDLVVLGRVVAVFRTLRERGPDPD